MEKYYEFEASAEPGLLFRPKLNFPDLAELFMAREKSLKETGGLFFT